MIRPASAQDVPFIANLFTASTSTAWDEKAIIEAISSSLYQLFIWEEMDVVSGAVLCRRCADEVEIINLAVLPAARRKGIGRALMRHVIASLSMTEQLYLEVRSQNTAAIALYKALNFVVIGRRRGYYAHPADDAILMNFTKK